MNRLVCAVARVVSSPRLDFTLFVAVAVPLPAMDIDDPQPPHHLAHHTNAVAGPSSLPADIPSLFLPPPGPSFLRQYGSLDFADSPPRSGPPHPKPYFKSTEDLITRFQLLPAYDKYVRPFAPPVAQVGATDKGKGKEIPPLAASSPAAAGPAGGDDGEEEDGAKGEKKHKNYRHLIKAVPGMCFVIHQIL